jgi:hypothetical protein
MLTPKARLASSRDKTQKQRNFMFNQPKKQEYFIWNPCKVSKQVSPDIEGRISLA